MNGKVSDSGRLGGNARRARLGVMLKSLVSVLCGGAILGGAAAVLDPQSLLASSPRTHTRQAAQIDNQKFTDAFAALLGASVKVLALHDRPSIPAREIVLWTNDRINPGTIDPQEISLISHNRAFSTITAFSIGDEPQRAARVKFPPRVAGGSGDPPRVAGGSGDNWQRGTGRSAWRALEALRLDEAGVADESFCDRWRALPQVRARVMATGISDMALEEVAGPDGQLSLLRLSLKWGAESADGVDEATAFIEPGTRRCGAQE